jgi:hypothetical protein
MTAPSYSDEQVEAALEAYYGPDWQSLPSLLRKREYMHMRRALAAASVPIEPTARTWNGVVERTMYAGDTFSITLHPSKPLVLPPAEPQPDAPTEISALPDYWDERRAKQGKPDKSRCAAELRIALAHQAAIQFAGATIGKPGERP